MKDFEQDLVLVLVQNNLSDKECRDQEKPAPSTLALINSNTGTQLWKVDLAAEVTWTKNWRKEIVNAPGLNEIILKLTDVNGSDAGGDKKSVDENDDRKMKTLIPFNKLNGRITDPVIAKSTAQPTMQAPVVEVLTLPGNTQDILVISNGSDKDFRYAYHRAKNLSSSDWSYESNLKPIGGNPLVGNQLILAREDKDKPVAVNLADGKAGSWAGPAGGKMYFIHGFHVHVKGDGVTDKVSNAASQGGKDGHDVKISGIDADGGQRWSLDSRGFALGRYVPVSRMIDRDSFSEIFAVSGDSNRTLTRIDPSSGKQLWSAKTTADQFEVSKLANASAGVVYLTAKDDSQAKSFAPFNLDTGKVGKSIKIDGAATRVDGITGSTLYVVNEPERKRIIADIESGKQSNSDDDGKDKSDETRTCLIAVNVADSAKLWDLECNGNEHVALLGGNWMMVDKTPGHEKLWPLAGRAN
jgi:outer membrane protein assembly factor BamB